MERAFVANGSWQNAIGRNASALACDPAVQRKATLRVSAFAAIVTLGLIASPDFRPDPALTEAPRRISVAMPEIVAVKPADRVPAAGEPTSAFQRRPRPAAVEATQAAAPAAPVPGIEIVDAVTLRAGEMTVRIAGLALPSADRTCRRLDGLAVACVSRAESYLELLVRGRAVACDRPAWPLTASRSGAAASARPTSPSRWCGKAGPRRRTATSRRWSWPRRRPGGRSSASGATERRVPQPMLVGESKINHDGLDAGATEPREPPCVLSPSSPQRP